jgi:hypothetical protein
MKKMTKRSQKWLETVVANCKSNTGRTLAAWVALAKKARLKTAKEARVWAKDQGLSIVYQGAVMETLFPATEGDDALVDAQYSGKKALLRPILEALIKVVGTFGGDVEVMPRQTQITFSRAKSFAVVRAATTDRVDVALKLHGEKGTRRLVLDAKAMKSDPSHVVALGAAKDVDTELVKWLRLAYERARE